MMVMIAAWATANATGISLGSPPNGPANIETSNNIPITPTMPTPTAETAAAFNAVFA